MPSVVAPLTGAGPETVVWRLAYPLRVHVDRKWLYAAWGDMIFDDARRTMRLEAGGWIRFDRLLNVFPHKKWVALTGVSALTVRVTYRGGDARFAIMTFDGVTTRAVTTIVLPKADETAAVEIPLPPHLAYSDLLFFHLDAEGETELDDIEIVTRARPANAVRPAVVITTFNRPAEVEEQAGELEALSERGELDYHVFVIDNGRNLAFARRYRNTTVVDSPNLGGAGGFTRGLLEAQDAGGFTHALFMDDDAYCHPEALLRAVAVLRYAGDPRLAFAGAMHYLHAPEKQYELGGKVAPYGVESVRMDTQVNELASLHANERSENPHYGAWWCFLFPLKAAKTLPFPFFVRGDDVTFSLQNRFTLETLPGLVAWQPSFDDKISASVEYLAHRSYLAMPLIAPRPEWTRTSVVAGARDCFFRELEGLRYPLAEALCQALEDVLTGPSFWASSANTRARMEGLSQLEAEFTQRSFLPHWGFLPAGTPMRKELRPLYRLFGRRNVPAWLCKRRVALVDRLSPQPGMAFLRPGIIYTAPGSDRRMSCKRDGRWRRRLERRFARLAAEYAARFDELSADYAASGLQSREAWDARLERTEPERSVAHSPL